MPRLNASRFLPCATALVTLLTACHRTLVDSPRVLCQEGPAAFEHTPDHLRSCDIPIFYVTDRVQQGENDRGARYGHHRSETLGWGEAVVSLSPDVPWEELVADSVAAHRKRSYAVNVESVRELGRAGSVRKRLVVQDGRLVLPPEALEAFKKEGDQFRGMINERVEDSHQADVYIYIHGFKNQFDDAIRRAAEVWHFLGRRGVMIAYTWPAGSGSGLFGYEYDRESSEFTVSHLKLVLRALAKDPEVERIHIISHSRGTEVAVDAVRELHLECVARGVETCKEFKLATLVLAAPDLDLDVMRQRFVGENATMAAETVVVYYSPRDEAIKAATILFSSGRRVGRMRESDFAPETLEELRQLPRLQFINCDVRGGSSHSYLFEHPAAFSDLILLLRDRRPPGAEHGRPLTVPAPGLWQIDQDYPAR